MTKVRHLISLNDLDDDSLIAIAKRGVEFADGLRDGENALKGLIIGVYFRKASTRTRTAFSSAALRLDAKIISYGPHDLQENTGEAPADTARVLSHMLDGLIMRTAGDPCEMRSFAAHDRMAVINAMSMDEHPTQALADITTLLQHFGDLRGIRVLYMGEGNNTISALAYSLTRMGSTELFVYTPEGYGLDDTTMRIAREYARHSGSSILQCHDPSNLPDEVDVVYTTRWQTTGTTKSDDRWREKFQPFAVNEQLIGRFHDCVFMHDLPAHRGEEVTSSVLEGVTSLAFKQAKNKLYSAMAVLEWCFRKF